MPDPAELLHDIDPRDPYAWQTAATMAAGLGIAERTVRARAQSGSLERCAGPGGRTYYRQPRPRQPMAADSTAAAGLNGSRDPAADADALQAWAVVVREQLTQLETVRASLTVAEVTVARLTATAEERARVHDLELDAVRTERQRAQERAEQTEAALALATTRTRLLERLAACSWYAVRVRRRLRQQLEELDNGTSQR